MTNLEVDFILAERQRRLAQMQPDWLWVAKVISGTLAVIALAIALGKGIMNHKDQALRIALIFLLACSRGAQPTREQFKRLADLCGIALPMRHRLTREEFEAIAPDSYWDRTEAVQ